MQSPHNHVVRIGDWRVDPTLDEISKDGASVKLEPRTMRLLVCLAENAGQVLSVEQLLDKVWKDVVVTPNSVYHAVAELRRILGDDPKEPSYIANVLRRGYRLVAPLGLELAGNHTLFIGISHRAKCRIPRLVPHGRSGFSDWLQSAWF
jgi:DNA-binding winged helix-turn-helix (wHTH) protein